MEGPVRRDGRTSQKRWQDQSEEMAGPVRRDGRSSQEMAGADRRWQEQKEDGRNSHKR